MKKTLFIDTNILFNPKMKTFFKNEDALMDISKHADIVIPDMVIQELEYKYRRLIQVEKNKNKENLLLDVLNINIEDVDIEDTILKLKSRNRLRYKKIDIVNANRLYDLKNMALKKEKPFTPPFKDNREYNYEGRGGDTKTDKGFKDAYIYFSIKDYILEKQKGSFFVCSDDDLFIEACDKDKKITIIRGVSEFYEYLIDSYKDDYFVGILKDQIDERITKKSIIKLHKNVFDDDLLL